MLPDRIFYIAIVCGKPLHTKLMIQSLCYAGIEPQHLEYVFTPTDKFTLNEFCDISGIIPHVIEKLPSKNSYYHACYSRILQKMTIEGYEWAVFLEDDVILNPSCIEKCMQAYHAAKSDGYNVGLVSPLDWGFEWYNLKTTSREYRVKEWFTTHCVLISREVMYRAFDLTRPFWHEYSYEIDKFIGQMVNDNGYDNITTIPSEAFSFDGGIYAVESFRPETDKIEELIEKLEEQNYVKA